MALYKTHQKYYDTQFLDPDNVPTVLKKDEIYFQSFFIRKYKDSDNPFKQNGTYYTLRRVYDDNPNNRVQNQKVNKDDGIIFQLIEEIYEFRKNKL